MKEGTVKVRQYALALVVAFFVWLLHNLSLDYSSYLQYRVRLSTDIEGYRSTALSNEVLLLRGKGSGFYILKTKVRRHTFSRIELAVGRKYLTPVKGEEGVFMLKVSDVAEKIRESVEDFEIDFIETETLTFTLEPQAFKKVPVVLASDIHCEPQYMIVGDIELNPDSVTVSGNAKELEGISKVMTRSVALRHVDKSVEGIVALEKMDGFDTNLSDVHYSFAVTRYVERTVTVPVTVENTPAGRNLMVLPSSVTVTYRTPVRARQKDFHFEVDYRDYVRAAGSKLIPRMVGGGKEILSYEIEPRMVECISVAD